LDIYSNQLIQIEHEFIKPSNHLENILLSRSEEKSNFNKSERNLTSKTIFTEASEKSETASSFDFNNEGISTFKIYHCVENWPFHQSRMIYSYSSLLIQYILPILVVAIAYGSIWWKLNKQRKKLKNHTRNNQCSTNALAIQNANLKAQSSDILIQNNNNNNINNNLLVNYVEEQNSNLSNKITKKNVSNLKKSTTNDVNNT
jgi:hypothetical protein